MLQFTQFLEEFEHSNRSVAIGGEQVARLVAKFGEQVRNIGVWNHSADGSIEVPMENIIEAVQVLDKALRPVRVSGPRRRAHETGAHKQFDDARQIATIDTYTTKATAARARRRD
jgi:hypothetical protein